MTNPYKLLENSKSKINLYIEKIRVINPLEVLKRGYSVIYKDHQMVKKIDELQKQDTIDIRLYDGIIEAQIKQIKEKKDGEKEEI